MEIFDLGIAYNWIYDEDFVWTLNNHLLDVHLKPYIVHIYNVEETIAKVKNCDLSFRWFLDRASDTDKKFGILSELLIANNCRFINNPSDSRHASDKASMHLEFITNGINTPYTIILAPYVHEPNLTVRELKRLGIPFVIKPACEGGGVGVVFNARELTEIIEERKKIKEDKYLVQEKIIPTEISNRQAWFRVIYIFDYIYPCWWNYETHIYKIITADELINLKLEPLIKITKKIANICKLSFFSTEIAVDKSGKFIVVDYVNDPCDMRFQSKTPDGVPDNIIHNICFHIIDVIKNKETV